MLTELMLSSKGPFLHQRADGQYRIHSNGVSQIAWDARQHLFEFDVIYVLSGFDSYSNGKFHSSISKKNEWLYGQLLKKNELG